jgi:hypothetical protein
LNDCGSALSDNQQHAGSAKSGNDSNQSGYLGVMPPYGNVPQRGARAWVERPEQLLQAVKVLTQSRIVAIDAEFTQVRARAQGDAQTSSMRLALLQLAVEGQCYVIDALRLHDLLPLAEIVANPAYLILLYGASADMRVMSERGLDVAHYCDLEAASRSIFGQQESSLAGMLRRAFNIRLDKSLQRTDWTRRPLPPAMVAYAARDAEMTLALYNWLHLHFEWALRMHEYTNQPLEPAAPWIEPFLLGTISLPAEATLAEMRASGLSGDAAQMEADARAALATLTHPMYRNRLLRLIADASLTALAPDIEPLLQSPAADVRSSSARTLGRLGIREAKPLIEPLLQDPVFDVRKAAQTALHNLEGKRGPHPQALAPKLVQGVRSWSVGTPSDTEGEDDWKARLRAMMDQ